MKEKLKLFGIGLIVGVLLAISLERLFQTPSLPVVDNSEKYKAQRDSTLQLVDSLLVVTTKRDTIISAQDVKIKELTKEIKKIKNTPPPDVKYSVKELEELFEKWFEENYEFYEEDF